MNAPERLTLPDVQSGIDLRNLAIDQVGVKDLRYPLALKCGERVVHTIGTWCLAVELPPHVKGTHMSRFVEFLEAERAPLDIAQFRARGERMLGRLGAERGTLEVRFAYFIEKTAPVSGISSLLDYEVAWTLEIARGG